ncbi:RNA polymerase recycling motor HelD [Domibacillus iocasae]|uniref:Helicase n=1 Tax=Domibacillus iocasae TaxID=1714016 RepID=A0A1E7DQ52_9BACI|nr:RNA polymerase recycling motor HelD [Domibacillus iocasae]OES44808.1 helicase [Domibacillus iocasae]
MNQETEQQKEQLRVNEVIDIIDQKQAEIKEKTGHLKEGIIGLRNNFWEDVTVNMDEPDDVIETQAGIKQQAELLQERERSHGQLFNELKKLDRLRRSPYFGRIDFQESGEPKPEPIYIGIASLMDQEQENFLIYDWRAPVSSMYYDYTIGPAAYHTMEGQIEGDISLKRQFIIQNGEITGQFDTSLTIGDHILQAVLGGKSSAQMKNIVATIQREQNQIIRNQRSQTLIVQGAAGSGKTSAALQRIAFLLYANRRTLQAENMLLFSPNPLFNSYVSTVLPELGEENILQTTYKEYVEDRIGDAFTVQSPFEQLEQFLLKGTEPDDSVETAAIQFKTGLDFKKHIDDFLASLSQEGLVFHDIVFRNKILVSSKEIGQYFYALAPSILLPNRLELVSEWLLKKLKKLERLEQNEEWVRDEVELLDKEDFLNAYRASQKKQAKKEDTFNDADMEWHILSQSVVRKSFQPLRSKMKRLGFVDEKANFRKIFETRTQPASDMWAHVCESTLKALDQHILCWEDATAYLYFQDQLKGKKSFSRIRHVFIDEAQDYSLFQLAYLKTLFPYSKMTLLGDVNQSIFVQSSNESSVLSDTPSQKESLEKITLTRSYRSTRPIVEFTRQLIEGGSQIEPFNREGSKPTLTYADHTEDLHQKLLERIKSLLEADGRQTIAVICKTMQESQNVHAWLTPHLSAQLLDQETYTFEQGLVVIPAYLAKGIEFDAVILFNVSEDVYSRESERNLFYTACTRAMHELHLFSLGKETRLLQPAQPETYTVIEK